MLAFCAGALDGLVAVTPASGFVGARKNYSLNPALHLIHIFIAAAILIGVLASIVCNYTSDIVPVDDALGVRYSNFFK